MSLIHCSPLFLPLEPLPVMSPTVMRSGNRKSSSKNSHSGSNSRGSSDVATERRSPSTKGKKDTRCRSHPLADTALTMPVTDQMPTLLSKDSAPSHEDLCHLPDVFIVPDSPGERQAHISEHSSYHELSFDSQNQGSITFTVESQPMSDLSSSQQLS